MPGTGDKIISEIDTATKVLGTLVPSVAAIGGLVRLLATTLRPSDAQQAQVFAAAIATYDVAAADLTAAVAGFEIAKKMATAPPSPPSPTP